MQMAQARKRKVVAVVHLSVLATVESRIHSFWSHTPTSQQFRVRSLAIRVLAQKPQIPSAPHDDKGTVNSLSSRIFIAILDVLGRTRGGGIAFYSPLAPGPGRT